MKESKLHQMRSLKVAAHAASLVSGLAPSLPTLKYIDSPSIDPFIWFVTFLDLFKIMFLGFSNIIDNRHSGS